MIGENIEWHIDCRQPLSEIRVQLCSARVALARIRNKLLIDKGFLMKHKKILLEFTLAANWHSTVSVRARTASRLKAEGWDSDIIDAVTMCITELTENAVKYGIDAETDSKIHAEVIRDGNQIVVRVSNRVEKNRKFKSLIKAIEELHSTENPEELHLERMKEILYNPKKGSSKLGIYRIAYEGNFSINCKIEDGVLTVFAVHSIGKAT